MMTGVLLKAVSAGRPRQVRLLLDSGIQLESIDDCGQSPLIKSVFLEHRGSRAKIMKMLLRAGAKVSKTDVVGRNALLWACIYCRDREIKWLLQYADVNLDLNWRDYKGQTALFHSVTGGSAAIVKLLVDGLLKYGLSIEVPDQRGLTPLMQGIRVGHDVCCSILMHQGGATLGRGMTSAEDVEHSTKIWADEYTENYDQYRTDSPDTECENLGFGDYKRSNHDIQSRANGYFPPIVSQSCEQTIRYQEACAKRCRVQTPSTLVDDDCYSMCMSESSQVSERLGVTLPELGPTFGWTQTQPADSLSVLTSQCSVRTTSKTSSTEANVDSSDDEVDDRSRPVHEPGFQPTRDLHRMYHLFEAQKSTSYRPGAARPVPRQEESEDEDSVDTPDVALYEVIKPDEKITAKKLQQKCSGSRRIPFRKLPVRTRPMESHVDRRRPSDGATTNSSSESDLSEKLFVPTKKSILPKITDSFGRSYNYSNM